MKKYCCEYCEKTFKAREADRKRGWARFCGKSCKAKEQTRRTGKGGFNYFDHIFSQEALGQS